MSNNTIWMPKQEYEAWKELQSKMTPEDKQRMSYYFWNNFSYAGYEDFKKKRFTINKDRFDKLNINDIP